MPNSRRAVGVPLSLALVSGVVAVCCCALLAADEARASPLSLPAAPSDAKQPLELSNGVEGVAEGAPSEADKDAPEADKDGELAGAVC